MKINDLYEYNKGIQDPNSNAKQSNKNDDEMEMEPFTPDQEKEVAKGFKALGAKLGKPIQNPKMAAKGINKTIQGEKPTPAQLQSKLSIDVQFTKAMQTPALRNQLANILKKANDMDIDESTLAKKILKKLTGKKNLTKFKKRSKLLKEADPKLFEINFNKKEIAIEALDAPVKCGFEAETFFYSVDGRRASDDIDNMSISDIEYEYGDMPDQVWENFEDWLYTKGQDEYLDDIIEDKVNEVREDEDYLNDFIDSGAGPSSEAIEIYKKDFEENDPKEYENREEDGWDYMNWVREYVEEEYEDEYLAWLKKDVADGDLDDEAREAARDDYSVEDWIYDNYSYMSSFLDDYGYEYNSSSEGNVEGVADELYNWIKDNSKFTDYPEIGEYDSTNTTTAWSVETDSSIEADEGAGAELISPVFDSPRKMLTEMKSLFDWSEKNFGTNNSTGLHVTMSWQGEKRDLVKTDDDEFWGDEASEPNKLKMALLLGDEYLLAEFGRLRNSYTKSQYQNVLKYAEGMKRGDAKSFEAFEKELAKGIDPGKFNSINFKGETDKDSGNNLIEFRIAGGVDYNTMYDKVVKACVRYATVMKAGYSKDAFRPEYVKAVFRLLRKSQEIDPKKLKNLEVVNHEVIDAAKSIVGKKDYFDVIKFLSASVEYLQNYEKLSSPDADKIWKQEIKDFEKGTGTKVEIEEETIKGYVQPNSMSPSKRAAGELDKAQDRFGSAVTLLAKDIADGNNRAPVTAKNIASFRKFAKELQLNSDSMETLVFSSMENHNIEGSDKDKVLILQKGINTLFKQDIIKNPEYLSPQDVDRIASKMWQFYQSDDSKDNVKLDKLADLLVVLTPANKKIDVENTLRELSHERQENSFVAKLKGRGWNVRNELLKSNRITTKGSAQELLKFLEPYQGYKHPTSRDHHVNIKSDDKYSDVFQMRLTQRLRDRLDHLKDLEREDKEKFVTIAKQVSKLGLELLEGLKPRPDLWAEDENGYTQINRGSDGESNLASHSSLERWNDVMDRLVKADSEIEADEQTFNLPALIDDYVVGSMHMDRYFAWKENNGPEQGAVLRQLHKERFAAIKKFLSGFDKIFQKEGFVNLKQEIQAKNTLDRRNRDFEKNVRDNAKAKLNIPSHSWVYIDRDFFDTITDEDYDDREAYLDSNLDHFKDKVNQSKVYVIPSSHWSDAEDATNGLELIDTFEKNKNYYHTWRKKGYKKIVNRFNNKYGYSWKDLNVKEAFIQGDGDVYHKLKNIGIEVTHKGDSRKGAPGQDDLFPDEETQNPKSGEPLNRSYGISWENMDDEAEQKRFDAFDWEQYPAKMKDVVAKEMANKQSSGGSFKVALDNILKKVLDGDVGIDQNDLGKPIDKMAIAAGIEPDNGGSSNGIAGETDWGNLADHLGIERGVNDQGVNLLRKVYQQFDGDHNWRPAETDENGKNVIGLARWGAAVRDAEKYIRDNYNVSGGNYFRKDADGNDDDDVSGVYGSSDWTNTDYDKARKHRLFNIMMQQGMQNYLPKGEVNKLVAFLNNPQQDTNFKKEVLAILRLNGPFDTFMGAVNAAKEISQESIFTKFDKLPLQEQLRILHESNVLEKFTRNENTINTNMKKFNEGEERSIIANSCVEKLVDEFSGRENQFANKDDLEYAIYQALEDLDVEDCVDPEMEVGGQPIGHFASGRVIDCCSSSDIIYDVMAHMDETQIGEAKKPKMPKQNNPVAKNSKNMPGAGAHKSPKDYDRKKIKADIRKELDDSTYVNNIMPSVFERFEKLPIQKQLELLNTPIVEGYFKNLDTIDKEQKRLGVGKYNKVSKSVKKPAGSYNKEQHIKNTYNKFKTQHGEVKAQAMLNKMIDRGYFDKSKTESLLGIDVLLRTKRLTENMPNNNKLAILKKLLSKHFPVGNLDMQFQAYLALPIPRMMTAFSQLKSIEGPEACGRDILMHFAKNRLPDAEVKQLNLNESYIKEDATEDRLNSIMTALEKNPNFARRVYKMLKLDKESADHLDIEDRLKNNDTGKENDHRINKNIMRQLVLSLEQLDHDFDEIDAFVETYGHADYVNTELLNKSGVFKISDMFVGTDAVSKEFIDDLYEKLFDFRINISGSNRGPGELGLCLLSPNVELASVGDIKVNGEEIEVKGEVSSGGGRMVNGIDDFKFSGLAQVKSQLVPFYEKHDIPEELRIYNLKGAVGGGRNQGQAHILDQAQQLEQVKQGVGAEFLKLIVSTYQFVIDSEEEAELTSSFMNMDKTRFLTLVGLMSFKNYAYMLNKKGFNRLIFLNWRYDKVVNCTTEEFPKYSEHLAFTSLDMADSQNGPAVQVSVLK